MVVPLGRALMAAEQPVLRAHGLSMWGYSVLLRLGDEPLRSQAELAARIGADKSRIIDVLDALQERGFITRHADPDDRRARLLTITPSGRRVRDAVQRAIQRNEERALAVLPPADRSALLRALRHLAELPAEHFAGETR